METKPNFTVKQQSEIYIGVVTDLLPRLLPAGRVIVISDANVDRLHHKLLAGRETILLGTGETIKTFATVESIIRRLIEMGADRSTFILGVGGGIVTDIAGFVASIYMRGVRFGFVPTTLLGQVDASIGGKNGVNVDGLKNMAGTICQPEFVICDPALVRTLSDRDFRAGMAEAVKVGILAEEGLFSLIERTGFEQLRANGELLEQVVCAAVAVKVSIVERDEHEAGERRKLNLGHTIAHAIEKCQPGMNHGEAVAVGMAVIAKASVRLGVLTQADCDRIVQTLEGLGFNLVLPVEKRRLLTAVIKDKKSEQGILHVVLPTSIGSCEVRDVPHVEFAALLGH